jgi:hypothetical protein
VARMRCWPMGFSWSPVVAHAVSMVILREAATRAGFTVEGTGRPSSPPPYWVVRSTNGKVAGFLVGYYDNILIITGSTSVRNALVRALKTACSAVNAILKGDIVSSEGKSRDAGRLFPIGRAPGVVAAL